MRRQWVLTPLPLLLFITVGAALSAAFYYGTWDNPVLFVRASLSVAVFALAILLSVLAAGVMGWLHKNRLHARSMQQLHTKTAEDRRRFHQRLDHELKNPLMAIRAALANIGDAPSVVVRQNAYASLNAQAVRLSQLTAEMRKIAELETRTIDYTPVSVASLLEEAVQLVRDVGKRGQRQIALSVPQAPWPLPIISGDWDLIFLAVYNLLENACKFTDSSDTIEVRAREEGKFVVIVVADTGPGIAAEDVAHVWEELYRGDGARGIAGSGLGLALVKAIVERHGGDADLHSKVGMGTAVTLRFPISPVEQPLVTNW